MSQKIQEKLNQIIKARGQRRRWLMVFVCLAVIALVGTYSIMSYTGQTLSYEKKVLDCHYEAQQGDGFAGYCAHEHNNDCYADGVLVCSLPEIKAHYHSEVCYKTERMLVCGLEENETEHVHAEDCYDESTELICGMGELHIHSQDCFNEEGGSICGKLQLESHVHGEDCFTAAETDEATIDNTDSQTEALPEYPDEGTVAVSDNDVIDAIDSDISDNMDDNEPDGPRDAESESTNVPEFDIPESAGELEPEGPVEDHEETIDKISSDPADTEQRNVDATPVEDIDKSSSPVVFTGQDDGITVVVEAPEGTVPDNAELVVTRVFSDELFETASIAVSGEITSVSAVDFSFRTENDVIDLDHEVPVVVSVSSEEITEPGSSVIVSIDSSGNAGVIEQLRSGQDQETGSNEVVFETDLGTHCVIIGKKIEKNILSSDGNAYRIIVTYPEEAGIPEEAELEVSEIIVESDQYNDFISRTEEVLAGNEYAVFARFFDISIVKDGIKIQPQTSVEVKIELSDRLDQTVKAVHFTDEDRVEVIDAALQDPEAEAMHSAVVFDAEGFSVYGIVVTDAGSLDGRSFGIIFNNDTVSGTALMSASSGNDTRLSGKTLTVRIDPVKRTENVFVAGNSDITMWSFSQISDSENKYYITTEISGETKYLKITNSVVQLVSLDEVDENCIITVQAGSGNYSGKFKFRSAAGALSRDGSTFKAVAPGTSNANTWFYLASLSNLNEDDFIVYTAYKVSVSGTLNEDGSIDYDVNNDDVVVIYTRIWNSNTGRYDYYAIDYDGMLVKAYESGDTISWVGSKVNTMLWNFTEYYYEGTDTPNYYYELQNLYSDKYLAPQVSGRSFMSDNPIGINLNGRRNLEYYTTVLAWDDPYYDYASLKVQDWQLTSAPISKADTFYFAVMKPVESTEGPTAVATIDHKPFGITLKMQDYENITTGSVNRSKDQYDVLGDTVYHQWTGTQGLLARNLGDDDYPVTTDMVTRDVNNSSRAGQPGVSLGSLYSDAMEVNNNFLLSTYQETGYFEYDSTKNFAHLITSTDDIWYGTERPSGGTYTIGDFVVYDQLGTTNEGNKDTLKHGQFLPYNDLYYQNKNGEWVSCPISTKYANEMDIHANPLSSLDPNNGGALYEIPYQIGKTATDKNSEGRNYVDHFFGIEMSASFMQSESGLDAWGHDLIFEFSGDDDFWFYVDGMLVLDLGGIHSALDASINFRTGEVVVNGTRTNLRTLYKAAYKENNPDASDDETNEWLNTIFKDDGSNTGTVFKDYSGHTMRMFYMERGAGASNLRMRFNLAPYTAGEVLLEKEISGTDNIDPGMRFPFQIWYKDTSRPDDGFIPAPPETRITDVISGDPVAYPQVFVTDGVTYNNVLFLIPGQTVSIVLPSEDTEYYITECGMNTQIFDEVTANNEVLDGTVPDGNDYGTVKDYSTEISTVVQRKKVIYNNHVSDLAQNSLNVTKKLWREYSKNTAVSAEEDPTVFMFRIYIGKDQDGQDLVYSTGKYYVKDPEGFYCIWDTEAQGFVSTGKNVFSDLSDIVSDGEWKSEQEQATFHTSPGGAIDKIPAGYTVEIPGLMTGTAFLVEERNDEIPAGYNLIDYSRGIINENGVPEASSEPAPYGEENNSGTVRDTDISVIVNNQHGYGLTLNKFWSDAPFMDDHDNIYFGVFIRDEEGPYTITENRTDGTSVQVKLRYVEDSVWQLGKTDTSINWFFTDLEEGKTLNDYYICEILLEGPYEVPMLPADSEGGEDKPDEGTCKVTLLDGCLITILDEGAVLHAGGKSNEHGYNQSFDYTVSYDRDFLTEEELQDPRENNSRSDNVSNSRPGIKLLKTDLLGNPLSGGVFVLEKAQSADGGEGSEGGEAGGTTEHDIRKVFVSGDDGLIAVAYLTPGESYTLTEVTAPYKHLVLIGSLSISVDPQGKVFVNGSEADHELGYYTINQVEEPTADNMPSVTIKNKPFALNAIKRDSVSGEPISGVKFELYREVTDYYTGYPMPDYSPMEGFEELVTGSDGLIPKINLDDLSIGNYYLHETATTSGYKPLDYYLHLVIASTGEIRIEKAVYSQSEHRWIFSPINDGSAVITEDAAGNLTVSVNNTPNAIVRILKKADDTDAVMAGVDFALYKFTQIENELPKEGEIPWRMGTTDENGLLSFSGLDPSPVPYYLYETSTLDGYILLDAPIKITISDNGVSAIYKNSDLNVTKDVNDSVTTYEIEVYNHAGYELPHTGGIGTQTIRNAGIAIFFLAGLALALARMRRRRKAGESPPWQEG